MNALLFLLFSLAVYSPVLCFSAGGFGATSKTKKGVSLSTKAKKLLKKHKNNVDAASADYFQSQISVKDDSHETRVATTWDTVALFLPQDYKRTRGKVEPYVERRLKFIAYACQGDKDDYSLLDVGCGDGALVPYLGNECEYSGLDLSSEMIDLAKQQHPKQSFSVGSFPQDVPHGELYDTILFNGSLQFFKDTRQTLVDAAAMLKPQGRIVLSHVNGGKFVKEECMSNPFVAVRNMPNNISLISMAEMMGYQVLDKVALLEGVEFDDSLDGNQDDFYLVALQKLE